MSEKKKSVLMGQTRTARELRLTRLDFHEIAAITSTTQELKCASYNHPKAYAQLIAVLQTIIKC